MIEHTPLAEIHAERAVPEEVVGRVQDHFVLGKRRTLVQDVEFAFLQLVEVADRALSPGINDPFTACSCIDELGSALALVLSKGDIRNFATDEAGNVRIVLSVSTFEGIVGAAFNQIRQHGRHDVAIVVRLLDVLAELGAMSAKAAHTAILREQADAVYSSAMLAELADVDERTIRHRYDELIRACGDGPART